MTIPPFSFLGPVANDFLHNSKNPPPNSHAFVLAGGSLSLEKWDGTPLDGETDLAKIREFVSDHLAQLPEPAKATVPKQLNFLIDKHNKKVENSTWIAITHLFLLIVTFGCYSYKNSLRIEKLPDGSSGFAALLEAGKITKCLLREDVSENTLTLFLDDAEIILKMKSNIATQSTDFIVNAANQVMLGGGGVDGAIGNAGGRELFLFRVLVPEIGGERCPTGDARLTDAGRLPSSFCIHAVGPVFDPDEHEKCRTQLLNAYRSSLKRADECISSLQSQEPLPNLAEQLRQGNLTFDRGVIQNAEQLQKTHREYVQRKIGEGVEPLSISFPTISTGAFGYPQEEAANLSLQAVLEYVGEHQGAPGIKTFQFVFLDGQSDVPFYRKAFQKIEQLLHK